MQVSVLDSPYFAETSERIGQALFANAKSSAHFPENEQEFRQVLQEHGIDWDALRDPWGRPYRFRSSIEFAYGDKITVQAYGQQTSTQATPVTRKLKGIMIWSDGPDLTSDTPDDFVLARFSSPFAEESSHAGAAEMPQKMQPVYSGNSGALRIEVRDQSGAAIANANVALSNQGTGILAPGT